MYSSRCFSKILSEVSAKVIIITKLALDIVIHGDCSREQHGGLQFNGILNYKRESRSTGKFF